MADIANRVKVYLQKAISCAFSCFLFLFFFLKAFLEFYNESPQKN